MIGRVVNPSNADNRLSKDPPVQFIMRSETGLADWLNETGNKAASQIVASGIKKESFNCQYAPFVKDLHTSGSKGIIYKDSWDDKALPMGVSCSFVLYDPKNPQEGLMFKRDIYLAPVASYYNEQQ